MRAAPASASPARAALHRESSRKTSSGTRTSSAFPAPSPTPSSSVRAVRMAPSPGASIRPSAPTVSASGSIISPIATSRGRRPLPCARRIAAIAPRASSDGSAANSRAAKASARATA